MSTNDAISQVVQQIAVETDAAVRAAHIAKVTGIASAMTVAASAMVGEEDNGFIVFQGCAVFMSNYLRVAARPGHERELRELVLQLVSDLTGAVCEDIERSRS